jgi:hypothetical protein
MSFKGDYENPRRSCDHHPETCSCRDYEELISNTMSKTAEVLEIIQNNYKEFKGTNEAELHSAEEIADIIASKDQRIAELEARLETAEKPEFVKSKTTDNENLITWKTPHGLYNVIAHSESVAVSYIPFDEDQRSQLMHMDYYREAT